jgi:uncharacterized MAPEG superfamily protein
MKWSYLCLLIAGILPVVAAGIAKAGAKDYDNHDPRAWMSKLTGRRARADAAQANSFEAFPFFAVGVLLALQAGVQTPWVDALAIVFVLARIVYIACYVTDRASMRSLFWALGYLSVIGLYTLAILA